MNDLIFNAISCKCLFNCSIEYLISFIAIKLTIWYVLRVLISLLIKMTLGGPPRLTHYRFPYYRPNARCSSYGRTVR